MNDEPVFPCKPSATPAAPAGASHPVGPGAGPSPVAPAAADSAAFPGLESSAAAPVSPHADAFPLAAGLPVAAGSPLAAASPSAAAVARPPAIRWSLIVMLIAVLGVAWFVGPWWWNEVFPPERDFEAERLAKETPAPQPIPLTPLVAIIPKPATTRYTLALESDVAPQQMADVPAAEKLRREPSPLMYLEPPRPKGMVQIATLPAASGPQAKIERLRISKSGRIAASGLSDGRIELYDVARAERIGGVRSIEQRVTSLALDDELTQVGWIAGGRLFRSELQTGAKVAELVLPAAECLWCDYIPGESALIAAARRPGEDYLTLIRWDYLTDKIATRAQRLAAPSEPPLFAISEDHVAVFSRVCVVTRHDLTLETRDSSAFTKPAITSLSAFRDLLILGNEAGHLSVRTVRDSRSGNRIEISGNHHKPLSLSPICAVDGIISADRERKLYAYGGGDALEIWNLDRFAIVHDSGEQPAGAVSLATAINVAAGRAFTATPAGTIQVYELPGASYEARERGRQFHLNVAALLEEEEFAQLETVYAGSRQRLDQRGEHGSLHACFWIGIAGAGRVESLDFFRERLRLLEAYAKEFPKSIVPWVGLAEIHFHLGMAIRRSVAGSGPTREQQALIQANDDRAKTFLMIAEKIGDDPQLWATSLGFLTLESGDFAEFQKLLARHLALDLAYGPFLQRMSIHLLPDVHGQAGDLGRLATRIADRAPQPELGDEIYVILAEAVLQAQVDPRLADAGFDYERFRAAARRICARTPNWDELFNRRAQAAWIEGDRAEAELLMRKHEEQLAARWWNSSQDLAAFKWLATAPAVDEPGRRVIQVGRTPPQACQFSVDGRELFIAQGGRIKAIDLSEGSIARTLDRPAESIEAFDIRQHGVSFFGGNHRNEAGQLVGWLRFEDTTTGVGHPLVGHDANVISTALSSDERWLCTLDARGLCLLWDVEQDCEVNSVDAPGHVTAVDISPDGSRLALASYRSIRWLDRDQGRELGSIPTGGDTHSVYFSADSARCVWLQDRTLCCAGLDEASKASIRFPLPRKVASSFDRQHFAVAYYAVGNELRKAKECEIALVALEPFAVTKTLRAHDLQITALALSPDGRYVAACGVPGVVILWDLEEAVGRPYQEPER